MLKAQLEEVKDTLVSCDESDTARYRGEARAYIKTLNYLTRDTPGQATGEKVNG